MLESRGQVRGRQRGQGVVDVFRGEDSLVVAVGRGSVQEGVQQVPHGRVRAAQTTVLVVVGGQGLGEVLEFIGIGILADRISQSSTFLVSGVEVADPAIAREIGSPAEAIGFQQIVEGMGGLVHDRVLDLIIEDKAVILGLVKTVDLGEQAPAGGQDLSAGKDLVAREGVDREFVQGSAERAEVRGHGLVEDEEETLFERGATSGRDRSVEVQRDLEPGTREHALDMILAGRGSSEEGPGRGVAGIDDLVLIVQTSAGAHESQNQEGEGGDEGKEP